MNWSWGQGEVVRLSGGGYSNTFMNAKLQQAGESNRERGERLHDSTPLGATESPSPPPLNMTERRDEQEDKRYNKNTQREEESQNTLLPLRMAHHDYIMVWLW